MPLGVPQTVSLYLPPSMTPHVAPVPTVHCGCVRYRARMSDAPNRWMTYRELADELGISYRAAEARARRNVKAGRWPRRLDNSDGLVRVLIPATELDTMREGTEGEAAGGARGDTDGGTKPHADESRTIKALEGEIAVHRERADQMQAERNTERARADRADREREEARVEAAIAKAETRGEREARAAETKELREALAEARKPFWRRWMGGG